jgi:lipoprotein-anchoring transpeptidase ErfK/SrfK
MKFYYLHILTGMAVALVMSGCQHSAKSVQQSEYSFESDTVPDVAIADDSSHRFEDSASMMDYLEDNPEAAVYSGGIIPVIAEHVPEYADKLLASQYNKFLVVDKASMRVILYDKYGQELRAYDMACAKNYGNKHKKGDSRTPEGFFYVQGTYDSTDWLFTDDNGVQSKKKGQFGPRFIRLRIPGTSQIGIHGTCSPWSIGHRASHGCIRITNENIMELVDLVEPGMPAIVLPGKRDRKVNREEGYSVPYFPTAPKYAMSESEKKLKPEKITERDEDKPDPSDTNRSQTDTVKIESVEIETSPEETTDTLQGIF